MRILLIVIGILLAVAAHAQTGALYTGLSHGRFYSLEKSGAHFSKNYQPQIGYQIGAEIKDVALDTGINIDFVLTYQNYGGYFYRKSGGLGSVYTTEGEITKEVLGLEIYPWHIRPTQHLRISFGASIHALLDYEVSGSHYGWRMGTSPGLPGESVTTDLKDVDELVKSFSWGVNARVGYEFEIGKIIVEPRYNFYGGLVREFKYPYGAPIAMRHAFQLSVGYRINSSR